MELWENLLASWRLFASFRTDKSTRLPGNIVIVAQLTQSWGGFRKTCYLAKGFLPVPGPINQHAYLALLYSFLVHSVLEEYLLVCARLFASFGTSEYLAIMFTFDLVTQLIRSSGGTRKPCYLYNSCWLVLGSTSPHAYLVILSICDIAPRVTWS